jgi:hypothetical protein
MGQGGSKKPVKHPLLTSVLIEDLMAASEAAGRKPQAFETPFRYSDAGKCGRALSMKLSGCEETEPFDAPASWVTALGTLVHEMWQESLVKRFPNAELEPKSQLEGLTSGHSDAVIPEEDLLAVYPTWKGGKTLFELKSMGGSPFSFSVGVVRQRGGSWAKNGPDGPKIGAILQGALNAKAHDCQTLVIGEIALEAASKGVARNLGLSELDRFIAEFHYSRDEWEPLAQAELQRLRTIESDVKGGFYAPRIAVNDQRQLENINPDNPRIPWNCDYCPFTTACKAIGPDPAKIP